MRLTFVDRDGNHLFASNNAQALPHTGDLVVYSFNIHDRDAWDQEELRALVVLNASRWRVLNVAHEFGRHEVQAESHHITVTLVPDSKK